MSKMKKSIIANFGLLSSDIETGSPDTGGNEATPSPALPPALARVGAGVIGAAQRSIGELRDERDRLKALLESGQGTSSELDPATVDPSPFPDRLADDSDAEFLPFKQSMEVEGQKVPIQVRPHPQASGRYQVIYGHRRLRAARELGIRVRAIVLDMTDRELVVAQGIENSARQDLTWIERALFAGRMDEQGIKPRDIKAALAVDDAEMARMRAVYRGVPTSIVERVGRAPKVGRPRWVEFARLFSSMPDAASRVGKTLSADKVFSASSDDRFRLAFDVLKEKTIRAGDDQPSALIDVKGRQLGTLKITRREVRLIPAGKHGAAFAAFLKDEIPQLIERFAEQNSDD